MIGSTAEEQASWHFSRAYIDHWFSFCITASWKYCSAALSEGTDLNINSYHSCLWLRVFEVNWIDSHLLRTFLSLTCIGTLHGHNEEKVIRPLPDRHHLRAFNRAEVWFCCCPRYRVMGFFAFLSTLLFLCGRPWLRCCRLPLALRIYEPAFVAGSAFLARVRCTKGPGLSLGAGVVVKSMWSHCRDWLFLKKSIH